MPLIIGRKDGGGVDLRALLEGASGYLLFMRREGDEDFSLLALRDFGKVKAAPQLGRYLVEFFWRDLEVTMRLLKAQMRFTRLGRAEFERPARDLADPQGSHELEARQPIQVLRVPFPEGCVLRSLSHDWVLHHRVTKMVNDRSDGEDAAKSFIETLLGLRVGLQRQCQCYRE